MITSFLIKATRDIFFCNKIMEGNIKARSYEGRSGELKWKIREAPHKLFMLNNSVEK